MRCLIFDMSQEVYSESNNAQILSIMNKEKLGENGEGREQTSRTLPFFSVSKKSFQLVR